MQQVRGFAAITLNAMLMSIGGDRPLHQVGHIQYHCHLAVAEDSGAAYSLELLEDLAQGLDYRLELAHQFVHNEAGLLLAVLHNHDIFTAGMGFVFVEHVAQLEEGQYLTAQVDIALAARLFPLLLGQFNTLQHHIERDDERGIPHPYQEAVDDR